MKNFWVLVLALIPFNSLVSQEVQHTQTVQQRRADQRLWMSKLENNGANSLGYEDLIAQGREMHDCETVDPDNKFQYYNMGSEIAFAQLMRVESFLFRHNLRQQFKAEDAQGQR